VSPSRLGGAIIGDWKAAGRGRSVDLVEAAKKEAPFWPQLGKSASSATEGGRDALKKRGGSNINREGDAHRFICRHLKLRRKKLSDFL